MTKEIDNSMIRMPKELQAELKKMKKYKKESYSGVIKRLLKKQQNSEVIKEGGCMFCSRRVTSIFRGTPCCSKCFQKLRAIVKSKNKKEFEKVSKNE